MQSDVSVIIPCFRCADTIGRAVQSVVAQTLLPEEIILIDDFSDDDGKTLNALFSIQKLYPFVKVDILSLSVNMGPGVARNAGWDKASTKYLAFLDSDDSWHPKKLEIQVDWMNAHPAVSLSATESVHRNADKAPVNFDNSHLAVDSISASQLLRKNVISTRSVIVRRDINFRFDPLMRYAEDYLLWLRIVLSGNSAMFIRLPLAYSYRFDFAAGGLSSHLWRMQSGLERAYFKLRCEGYINSVTYIVLVLFSWGKFSRRIVISLFIAARTGLFGKKYE